MAGFFFLFYFVLFFKSMCLQLISSPQSQGISSQRAGWRGGGVVGRTAEPEQEDAAPGQTWDPHSLT